MEAHQHQPVENSAGETVCRRCGLVLEEAPAITTPVKTKDPTYHDEPPLRKYYALRTEETHHDRSLGTDLKRTFLGRWEVFQEHSGEWKSRWLRIRRELQSYREKRLRDTFCEMDRICHHMGLTKRVQTELCHILRTHKVPSGAKSEHYWAQLVYIVCNLLGIPRTLAEIKRAFEEIYGKGALGRHPTKGIGKLAIQLGYKLRPTNPHDYIDRLASALGVDIAPEAHEIADGLRGNPYTVAATAIWIASGLSSLEISRKLRVSISAMFRIRGQRISWQRSA